MSCFAGMWHFDGRPIDREFLARFGESIDQYGPDAADDQGRGGPGEYVRGPLAMIYRAFNTNKESRLERQPYVSKRGNVLTWDGRLDNRQELTWGLCPQLVRDHQGEHTDAAIVMAAWETWGTNCFKKLIGDFALAIWNAEDRTLTLAKDFMGVRYLYYEILTEGMRGGGRISEDLRGAEPPKGPGVWWCSRLEPLILLSGRQYELNEEYIAGYFAFHPANHLTPYVGVDALPAGHYVQVRLDSRQSPVVAKRQYWHFDPDKRITYRTDAEYEEHFRQVFFQSVKRRLRADSPVVAGLSGGRDSSAIVCVADELIAKGEAEVSRLDTYSRYDEEEPFGNDKPFLMIVEEKRGRKGHHFGHDKADLAALPIGDSPLATRRLRLLEPDYFSAHPAIDQGGAEAIQRRMDFIKANGYRIILSGIGGDEITGGVPYCISELADLLIQGRLGRLATRIKAWSMAQKRTWVSLAWNIVKSLEPKLIRRASWTNKDVWPWIDRSFVHRHAETFFQGTRVAVPCTGLPSFRTNVSVAAGVSWQLASTTKLHRRGARENHYDRGFPFLDRDFLEFMFSIPRDQVLRPGQYRSLMRRSLQEVVPDEILNRTRKAFGARRPALGIQSSGPEIRQFFTAPLSGYLGYLHGTSYLRAMDELVVGKNSLIRPVEQTLRLEIWFRSLAERSMLTSAPALSEKTARVLEGVA